MHGHCSSQDVGRESCFYSRLTFAIFSQEDPVIKGKTIAEAGKVCTRQSLIRTLKEKVQTMQNEQKDEVMRYEQIERDLIAALPDNPSNADIEAVEARLDEEFPGRDQKRCSIKKNKSV